MEDYQKPSSVVFIIPTIKDIEINEKTDKYEIQVKYPELQGSSTFSDLNNFITEKFQKSIDDFKKDEGQNFIAEVGAPSYFQIGYEAIMLAEKVVSIRFGADYYVAGMAHPNIYYESLNYDLINDKQISLADLFNPGSDYLTVLSNFSRETLKTLISPDYYSEDFVLPGTEPTLENFQVFNFTKDKIVITFNPYQVGPWVIGPQFVEIPFSELVDIINQDGIIK